jgi:hypothetical protein
VSSYQIDLCGILSNPSELPPLLSAALHNLASHSEAWHLSFQCLSATNNTLKSKYIEQVYTLEDSD